MKKYAFMLILFLGSNAFGFATQDMPKPMKSVPGTKLARTYGPPVKLDLSYNHCVKKGDAAYNQTLFYEEFDSLADCLKARERG